jgi:cysteine-rich repeat protein
MNNERIGPLWVWMGTCIFTVGACIVEGEYLPDMPPPGILFGAAANLPICGDGIRGPTEDCDDSNSKSGDGCDHDCRVESCFTCTDDPAARRSICGPACNELLGQTCFAGVCVSCADGLQNGRETDVDCGGGCAPCDVGRSCTDATDCIAGFCSSGVCCNESCDSTCIRCNLPDSIGICAFVPEGETHDDPLFACHEMAVCDGKGACKKSSAQACNAGIECLSGQCWQGSCK